jgi:DUF1365 family protein
MRSLLYEGSVWHERSEPAYRLEHRVFYVGFDLGELGLVDRELAVFSRNHFNLFSLHDKDYDLLPPQKDSGVRTFLTIPRILGYAFNPVSFLLTRGEAPGLTNAMAEVHNTWGERHVYDLPPEEGEPYRSRTSKAFYVSPFLESQGEYEFTVSEEADGSLDILISEALASGNAFAAWLHLTPRPLTTSNLLRALVRYPLLNWKVIAAIHWHAVRIWLRGARFHAHPKPASPSLEAKK